MADFSVNINRAIVGEVAGTCKRASGICGGKAESYAKMGCPVDTGNLRNSITHQLKGDDAVIIGTAIEYAPYLWVRTRATEAIASALDHARKEAK